MVVGCHNRYSKQRGLRFYRFAMNKDCCHLWIAIVSKRNPDGSPWQPSSCDRVCSDYFIYGKKSDLPGCPDFVLSIQTKELELPGFSTCNDVMRILIIMSTLDGVPECKDYRVRNWKRIDGRLNWTRYSKMIFRVLSHMTTLTHPAQYLVKGCSFI